MRRRRIQAYTLAGLLPAVGIAWCGMRAAAAAPVAAPVAALAPMPATAKPSRHKLANGVRVVVQARPSSSTVAIQASWVGGTRNETASTSGVTPLLARTITSGCGARGAQAVVRRAAELGGTIRGTSGRNTFGVHATWPRRNWNDGMRLLADCLVQPTFERSSFALAHQRHRATLAQRAVDGASVAMQLLLRSLYRAHPYRLDPIGDPKAVASMTRPDVRAHYRSRYPLSQLVVVVVGDVKPGRVVQSIRRAFGGRATAPASAPVATPRAAPRSSGRRHVYAYLQQPRAEIMIGFPGTAFANADRYALAVLAELLGGPVGKLSLAARDTGRLVYPVRVHSVLGIERGFFAVHATCDSDGITAVHAALRKRLAAVASSSPDAASVARAKRSLLASDRASRGSASSMASALAFHELHGLGLDAYVGYRAAIERVTVADVQRIAAAYLDLSRAVTATVMPRRMSPGAARRVRGVRKRAPRRRRTRRHH